MLTKDEHMRIRALIRYQLRSDTDTEAVMNIINGYTEGNPVTRVNGAGHIFTRWPVKEWT